MSVSDNKLLTRGFYASINQRNLDALDELISEDFVEHEQFPGLPTTGRKAVQAALDVFLGAFPDVQFAVDDIIGEDDKIVVRGRLSGTHQGEFMGIPATNKSFEVGFIDILEIHDGQATAHWGQTDQGAMMQQLGLAPEM
jgi:steroid delta-isomerase-like uncharacterized protein